jgi:hypothetical protein
MLMAAAMFGVVGAALLVFGGLQVVKAKRERATGTPVDGRVVEVKHEDGWFQAVWEATTPSGETVRARSPLRSNVSPTVGASVPLLYLPNAAQPLVRSGLGGYLFPIIILVIGAVFLFLFVCLQ